MSEWKKIGEIGVDAGLCWIGDPCYIIHAASLPKALGKNWKEFCDDLYRDKKTPTAKQYKYDRGHDGLGVCVGTGAGDGVYPVEARIEDGMIAEVRIRFM